MTIVNTLPSNIVDGDALDAAPVMANFNQIVTNVNANAADLNAQNTFSQPQNGVAAILPNQFVTLAQVQALFAQIVPIGTILDYGVAGVPGNFLACLGQAVNRTTYAALFAVIGTTWGVGDGATTFNVPNFARATSIGAGGSGTFGATTGSAGGAETVVISGAQLPYHTHGVNDPTHAHSVYDPGHNHAHSDPGHAHSIADPGHAHGYTAPGTAAENAGSFFAGLSTQAATTAASGTGIGIYAALTGLANVASGTGIGIYGAGTGISLAYAGASTAFSMMQPSLVTTKMIRWQ